jgi:hypothetical protein
MKQWMWTGNGLKVDNHRAGMDLSSEGVERILEDHAHGFVSISAKHSFLGAFGETS